MRKDLLTLLGCTGSMALVLMSGSGAKALMPPNFAGSVGVPAGIQPASAFKSTYQEDAPLSTRTSVEARLKQLAQVKLGCTCTNCINLVQQMVQQGTLSL